MTTLITGFGRCGTSLVLQMLQAGGFPVVGEYPAFEHEQIRQFNKDWLVCQEGAVKVLNPHHLTFEPGEYRIVWLDRSLKQQAASQIKFAFHIDGIAPPPGGLQRLAESLKRERPLALKALRELGPVLRITFEEILAEPLTSAHRIAVFVDPEFQFDLRLEAMAGRVIERPPFCRPDMRIEAYLTGEAEMAKHSVNGKEP